MPVLEGGIAKKRGADRLGRKMRMRLCTASKESYTLLSKKRHFRRVRSSIVVSSRWLVDLHEPPSPFGN
uniref:Uncharacterized protein n=1 Tax=Vespula pensylvanica TaxID=30213 RepID=A0A834P4V1_VESPE|nr:hypothetical protein H0235_005490 [Vespula pensylvanica]